ncbi:MAG TPA: GNAT family N-acetyltransferase [Pyrinomonadaceae bacterium]
MLTLETERLILRQWSEDDFEDYAAICADPEVMRYLGGKPFTRLEAWRHMAFLIGHWQLRGYGHWAVEEKATGRVIGRLGFLNPEGWPGFEVGWTLARDAWGKGYASEGARHALSHAFTEMGRDHVISLIHPENRASMKVAERMGEKPEGETEILGIPVIIYGISKETWEKLKEEQKPD